MCWDRLTLFLLALVFFPCAQAQAAPPANTGPLRVLVVHSYNAEYIWTQNINQGVQESLRGLSVIIETRYMDAKRKPDPAILRNRAEEILERIDSQKPQVVITVDDAAQVYLAAPYLKDRESPQVIFCGVNAPLKNYGFPAANVSGVRERWHFRDGFALLKKIKPDLRSVALMLDDSESGGFVADDLSADLKQYGPMALKLAGVERLRTFQQWQRKVRHYQTAADALALGMYHSLVDEATGQVVPADTVNAWTQSVNKLPTLGFADYAKEHGLLCGVLESGHEQGFLAGSMARAVLERGVPAGSLPVRINQKGIVVVNLKAAQRLRVPIPFEIISAAGVVIQ